MTKRSRSIDIDPKLPAPQLEGLRVFGIVPILDDAEGTAIITHLMRSLELNKIGDKRVLILDLSDSDHFTKSLQLPEHNQYLWNALLREIMSAEISSLSLWNKSEHSLSLSNFTVPVNNFVDLIPFPPVFRDPRDAWILAILKRLPDLIFEIRIKRNYDFILLNLSPTLSSSTEFRDILSTVNHVLIPFNFHKYLALDYIYELSYMVTDLRTLGYPIAISGIFPTEFGSEPNPTYDLTQIQRFFGKQLIFPTLHESSSLLSNPRTVLNRLDELNYFSIFTKFDELNNTFPYIPHEKTRELIRSVLRPLYSSETHTKYKELPGEKKAGIIRWHLRLLSIFRNSNLIDCKRKFTNWKQKTKKFVKSYDYLARASGPDRTYTL